MTKKNDRDKQLDDEILNVVYTFLKHYEEKENELARGKQEERKEESYV